MSIRKKVIIVCSVLAVLLLAGIGVWLWIGSGEADAEEVVYVDQVSVLMGLGSGTGVPGRFGGVVESQQTVEVKKNAEKTVLEVFVEEGQAVEVDTPLFSYDTKETEEKLGQAEIDLERIENEISTSNSQIEQLEKEKKTAEADEQLSYTTQIQTAQVEVKKKEYEKKSKAVEIEQIRDSINNATVTSTIQGIIKSVNDGQSQEMTGESEAFITILATGNYRIKGKANEQNLSAVIEGEPAIIHSRVDETQTWNGTFGAIDTDNPETSSSGEEYGMTENSMESSTSYNFYVNLDNADGLLLGQHVYIEADQGQEEEKTGVWLDEGYIQDIEEKPYVWADDGDGRLEKRSVTLGQYDEELCQYEITEGLDIEDAIAYPQEYCKEGLPTSINDGTMMENEEGISESEMEMPEAETEIMGDEEVPEG